ncbi:MAG: radical SAM protein [Candidatus Moranbacteria bacterium]|nr:radical SAM protein [Candidatus Moranbacteria bacterium]
MENIGKTRIIRKTFSICDKCLRKVPAETYEKQGGIVILKRCHQHGRFTNAHFWDDPVVYKTLLNVKTVNPEPANLSIALTNKCNLNCQVCYARSNDGKVRHFNIRKLGVISGYKGVLLTGGEPTIRSDLPEIIRLIRKKRKRVSIFSNGLKLADRNYLTRLKKSGLSGVIMQFDTLNPTISRFRRGGGLIKIKEKAINNVQKEKLPLYLYCVVLENNLYEIKKIIEFSLRYSVIKMVSFNTLGMIGRCDRDEYLPSSKIIRIIRKELGIKKKDWIESSRLLNSLDRILQPLGVGRRLFSKCSLKWMALPYKNELVPISKIFNLERINRDAEKLSPFSFLTSFVKNEVILNFFRNRYFRMLLMKTFKSAKYLFIKKYSLFNPFFIVAVTVVPSAENIDYDFIKECNIEAITPGITTPEPACLHRVKQNRA